MKYREVGFCQSHEDKTNDESADFSSTDELQFGCEENPDHCQHSNTSVRQCHLLCRAIATLALCHILLIRVR